MAALCSGCGLFESAASRDYRHLTNLTPQSAAWLVAEVCRAELPAADALAHANPPLLRVAPDRFVVRYCRAARDDFRVYTNGRMTPPQSHPIDTSTTGSLATCRFTPARKLTGSVAATVDEARIYIWPTWNGCEIDVSLDGHCAKGQLADRLIAALAAGQAVEVSGRQIEAGQFALAEKTITTALHSGETAGFANDRVQQGLIARLLYHRAMIAIARHDLTAARGYLSTSLSLAPDLLPARYQMFETCRRLGDVAGVRRNLPLLQQNSIHSKLHPVACARLRAGQTVLDAARNGESMAGRAVLLLAANDENAATHWARGALQRTPAIELAHRVLAEVHRRRLQPQRALVAELCLLTEENFDPKLLIRLAERYADLGNPAAGLRLLASFDQRLADANGVTARELDATLDRLSTAAGDRLAHRILRDSSSLSSRVPRLARALEGPAYQGILARHARNRASESRTNAKPAPNLALPRLPRHRSYQASPAVTPPR